MSSIQFPSLGAPGIVRMPAAPAARQDTFGDIAKILFESGRVSESMIAAQQQQREVESDVAQAEAQEEAMVQRQSALEQRVAIEQLQTEQVKAHISNERNRQRYQELSELERYGTFKILSEATPQERDQFFAQYKFLSPENENTVLQHWGRVLASTDWVATQMEIRKHYSDPNQEQQFSVTDAMGRRFVERGIQLPPIAKIAYENQFIPQAEAHVISAQTAANNYRQAQAVETATKLTDSAVVEWMRGLMPWVDDDPDRDDVVQLFEQQIKLTVGENAPQATKDRLLAGAIGRAFGSAMRNGISVDSLQKRYDEIPEGAKRFLGEIPEALEKERERLRAQDVSAAVQHYKSEADRFGVERNPESLRALRLQAETIEDPGTRGHVLDLIDSRLRTLHSEYSAEVQWQLDGADVSIRDVENLSRNLAPATYHGKAAAYTLREIQRVDPDGAKRLADKSGEPVIAGMLLRAQAGEELNGVIALFENPVVRENLPKIIEGGNTLIKSGEPGVNWGWAVDHAVPQPIAQRFSDLYVTDAGKRTIAAAEKNTIPNMDNIATAAGASAKKLVLGETVPLRGTLIFKSLLSTDPSGPSESRIRALDDSMKPAGLPPVSVTDAYVRGDGTTVFPFVDSIGPKAFMVLDRSTGERRILRATDADFGPIFTEYRRRHPEAMPPFQDLRYHDGMPSQYVSGVDSVWFAGRPSKGYESRIRNQARQDFFKVGNNPNDNPAMFEVYLEGFVEELGFLGIHPPRAPEPGK